MNDKESKNPQNIDKEEDDYYSKLKKWEPLAKREEPISSKPHGKQKRSRNYGGDGNSDGSEGPDCDDELRDSINTS